MRLVLDTNVLLSAFLWGGEPYKLVLQIRSGRAALIVTQSLIDELGKVLSRGKFAKKFAETQLTPEVILDDVGQLAERVEPAPVSADAVRDPKDAMVLACAVGGSADYIVSGDQDLLALSSYADIPIITVTRCLELLSIDAE